MGVLACRLHSWPSCVCAFALTGTHTYEHNLGDLAYLWSTHSTLIVPTPSGAADISFCLSSLLFLPSLQIPTSFPPKGSFTFIFQITQCLNSPCLCLAMQAYEQHVSNVKLRLLWDMGRVTEEMGQESLCGLWQRWQQTGPPKKPHHLSFLGKRWQPWWWLGELPRLACLGERRLETINHFMLIYFMILVG